MDMSMPPVDPNRLMMTRLRATDWNVVLAALNEMPHRIARPIIDNLMQQLRLQSATSPDDVERALGMSPET